MPPLLFHTIKALMIKKKNRYYSITRLNRKRLNQIYWMNRKIFQVRNCSFLSFACFKPKLSLNRSKMADSLRFGLTVLYCTIYLVI